MTQATYAVSVDDLDARWGLVIASSLLQGSECGVCNTTRGTVKLTGTTIEGPVSGRVVQITNHPTAFPDGDPPVLVKDQMFVATATPYSAPRGLRYPPSADATTAIQAALNDAKQRGGGVVYLPAGWYAVHGHLNVPKDVELRGASSVPHRDQLGSSGGTVLWLYEGRGTPDAERAPAAVTLDGDRASVRGLGFFWPENNPAATEGLVAYPFAIRGRGRQTAVVDVSFANAWNGIDFASRRNDRFLIRKVSGAFASRAIEIGAGSAGRIEGVLENGNAATRVGFALPAYAAESRIFEDVIDRYTRPNTTLVHVADARAVTLLNVFGYGIKNGLVVDRGRVAAVNLGTDNLGTGGVTVGVADRVRRGDVEVTNVLRYNGTTSRGPALLHNIQAIRLAQQTLSVEIAPDQGRVDVEGNPTEPGSYERGSIVRLHASAHRGFRFAGWTINSVSVAGPDLVLTMDADKMVQARFVR